MAVDPGDGNKSRSAAVTAARRELLEETGYGGGGIEPLVNVRPNPSNQANTAFCFLGINLEAVAARHLGGAGETQDVIEADLVEVLADLREAGATLHAGHVAALWSAAARMAADRSGQFDAVIWRLRQLLVGSGPSRGYHYVATHVDLTSPK